MERASALSIVFSQLCIFLKTKRGGILNEYKYKWRELEPGWKREQDYKQKNPEYRPWNVFRRWFGQMRIISICRGRFSHSVVRLCLRWRTGSDRGLGQWGKASAGRYRCDIRWKCHQGSMERPVWTHVSVEIFRSAIITWLMALFYGSFGKSVLAISIKNCRKSSEGFWAER